MVVDGEARSRALTEQRHAWQFCDRRRQSCREGSTDSVIVACLFDIKIQADLVTPEPESNDRSDPDEKLDKAAQGQSGTSDATGAGTGEIDAIGQAAGLVVRDGRPFHGIDEVDRRDEHRWENDPISADDAYDHATD